MTACSTQVPTKFYLDLICESKLRPIRLISSQSIKTFMRASVLAASGQKCTHNYCPIFKTIRSWNDSWEQKTPVRCGNLVFWLSSLTILSSPEASGAGYGKLKDSTLASRDIDNTSGRKLVNTLALYAKLRCLVCRNHANHPLYPPECERMRAMAQLSIQASLAWNMYTVTIEVYMSIQAQKDQNGSW